MSDVQQQDPSGPNVGWPDSFSLGENESVTFQAATDWEFEILKKPASFTGCGRSSWSRCTCSYTGRGRRFCLKAERSLPDNATALTITGGPGGGSSGT